MTHGSLFSGVGGFDLAAEWMGWENVFHCEINPFGRKILHYYWPNSISYENIKETDFNRHKGAIDIVSGGFPCQPFSQAGKRKGTADERHLWPEMLRTIREISPRWVVGENVRGLTNWDGGLVFDQVQADLETAGYQTLPLLLPACAVNAPHRRDRIWFIAHRNTAPTKHPISTGGDIITGSFQQIATNPDANGHDRRNGDLQNLPGQTGQHAFSNTIQGNSGWVATNPDGVRLRGKSDGIGNANVIGKNCTGNYWENFPTQSPVCSGNDGFPGRLVGITVPAHRTESLKAYGNAVVPQVVYEIFKAIQKYENLKVI